MDGRFDELNNTVLLSSLFSVRVTNIYLVTSMEAILQGFGLCQKGARSKIFDSFIYPDIRQTGEVVLCTLTFAQYMHDKT